MTVDASTLLIDGPWRHQLVPANGARFHVAIAGPDDNDAPLVVLLHGIPEFWWAWRHQLPVLAAAGYRVAAMDLRGTGASDKPPHGYDVPTLARDVAGLVRSLGADRAVVVGAGTGGEIAWAMPSSDLVVRLLREWGARGWTTPEIEDMYRQAARVPFAAHSAMERARWLVRSAPRVDGQRYLGALRAAPAVPVLQLHGGEDGCRPAATAAASGRLLTRLGAGYRFELIPDAGHFLAEEAPDRVNALLLSWLREVAPTVSP